MAASNAPCGLAPVHTVPVRRSTVPLRGALGADPGLLASCLRNGIPAGDGHSFAFFGAGRRAINRRTSARRTVTGTSRPTVTTSTASVLPALGSEMNIPRRRNSGVLSHLEACSQVQAVVPCRAEAICPAKPKKPPGGSSRAPATNAPPGACDGPSSCGFQNFSTTRTPCRAPGGGAPSKRILIY
jgi:hypothetical protein